MTIHPEQPVHDLAIRLDEENRRLREALAAARRKCELGVRALLQRTDAWLICGQCETDIYGEDFVLVTAAVAGCPRCESLRAALEAK